MTGRRRALAVALAALSTAAPAPGVALAGWTPALQVPLATGLSWQAQAVDARGDLIVAGVKASRLGRGGVASRVAVIVARKRATASTFRTETVASGRRLALGGLAVALDRQGAPTLTWVQRRRDRTAVVAAYRTAAGRWVTQTVGATSAFVNAAPRVAAAPDGTVVITYYAAAGRTPGMAASWRRRGGRFTTPQALRVGTRRGAYLTDPTLTFDSRGTALLSGTAACGQAPSTGVLYTGTARARRFTPGRVVAPAPAKSVRLVVTRAGTTIAWLTGSCTPGSEDLTGTPTAAVVRSGTATKPTALVDGRGYQLALAGAPHGATATWAAAGASNLLLAATINGDGTATPAQPPNDNWVAVAATPAGDQLLRQVALTTAPFAALATRRADTGAVEAAPVPATGFPLDAGTAAAPDGRALAIVSVTTRGPVAAVWRP